MKQKYCTMNRARQEHSPDCVTVTRTGGVILTVKDCGGPNAKGTAGNAIARGRRITAARTATPTPVNKEDFVTTHDNNGKD